MNHEQRHSWVQVVLAVKS